MNNVILQYSPPKASIWGHSPKTRKIVEIIKNEDFYTGMILKNEGSFVNHSLEILIINEHFFDWVNDFVIQLEKLIGTKAVTDGSSRQNYSWELTEADYAKCKLLFPEISDFPKHVDVLINLNKNVLGLLTLDQKQPLLAYDLIPGFPTQNHLYSNLVYSIGNFPYITTGYLFPYAPEDGNMRFIWNYINSNPYISLNSKYLKAKSFDGKVWKIDSNKKQLAINLYK